MASSNRGLGKGLDALFGRPETLHFEASDSLYIPIAQVESCSTQPRKRFDEDSLAELADSIREHGILQPLTVRRLSSGYYQIVAGERRWRAARMAGLDQVPVIVIEADDRKMAELALIENLQREDLSPIEEAEGYRSLIENYQMTQEEAAARLGKSRSAVANALRLLALCPEVRAMLEAGTISGGHARALLPLSPEMQKKAADSVVRNGLSVRQTEALVKQLTAKKPEKPTQKGDAPDYAKLAADALSDQLGRGCRIIAGRKKGKLELDYYDLDDLNELLERLSACSAQLSRSGGDRK